MKLGHQSSVKPGQQSFVKLDQKSSVNLGQQPSVCLCHLMKAPSVCAIVLDDCLAKPSSVVVDGCLDVLWVERSVFFLFINSGRCLF